mmetsp:Transcript_53037/g.84362  ORF Transcript_53037/g.84362 Transcript_53037/m.84362 type:complete len:149 (+) Transcript_53037:222-668(+)
MICCQAASKLRLSSCVQAEVLRTGERVLVLTQFLQIQRRVLRSYQLATTQPTRFLNLLRWLWKFYNSTVLKKQWLAFVRNERMHDWTVPVLCNGLVQALHTGRPIHFGTSLTDTGAFGKTLRVVSASKKLARNFFTSKVHKGITLTAH